jgi:hypothetical protein
MMNNKQAIPSFDLPVIYAFSAKTNNVEREPNKRLWPTAQSFLCGEGSLSLLDTNLAITAMMAKSIGTNSGYQFWITLYLLTQIEAEIINIWANIRLATIR